MKTASSLIFSLALTVNGFAQTDSLADVFPLAIGNKWTYEFSTEYRSTMAHSISADTGLVEYQVTGAAFSSDTIHWQFIQRRSGQHSSYYLGRWEYTTIKDSGTFEMAELYWGRHELYTPVYDAYRCFPFQKSYADSSRFFRYAPVDSLGRAAVRVSFVDPGNPYPDYNYDCYFTVSRDSGILQANGGQSNFVYGITMRYYLSAFSRSPYVGAYLSHPASVSLTSLVGILKDSTVVLRNIGTDSLRVQGIASSENALVASLPAQGTPPYSDVLLSLRYSSGTEGVKQATLVLTSNAVSSPDTIVVSIYNRIAALMDLDRRSIDFGALLLSRRYKDTTVTIANNGNVNLVLDSLWSTNPLFLVSADRKTIGPGETTRSTIRFMPSPPPDLTYQTSDIVYVTNSLSSPDTIQVSATALGGVPVFDTKAIDFGDVEVGSTADAVVRVTALGSAAYLSVQKTFPSNTSFAVLGPMWEVLEQGSTYADSVRFRPLNAGSVSAFIIYFWRSSYTYDTVAVTDTVRLTGVGVINPRDLRYYVTQNFPNPFNSVTRIGFGLPHDSFVSLVVFDLLGREVSTLVNEEKTMGSYQVEFSGERLASGLYVYRFRAGDYMQSKTLLLLK